MFSLNKRFIASLLVFAMIFANAGMSTLAVSITHYVDNASENARDDSDISYRYYEEYRYSYERKTTLLMNNGDDLGTGQGSAGDGAEKSDAPEETTGISETDNSGFDVENNESENNDDKVGSPAQDESDNSPEENVEDDDENESDYAEEPEEDETEASVDNENDETSETAEEETTHKEETRKYDEEFGPWQDETEESEANDETSESSEIGESSETKDSSAQDENDIDLASESDIEESEKAEGEEVAAAKDAEEVDDDTETRSDEELATISKLKKKIGVPTKSEIKLFGANDHTHKLCGIDGSATCAHVDMAAHTENITWQPFPTNLTGSAVNSYINNSSNPAYLYLDSDITINDGVITLSRNVNICLNGHSLIGSFAESTSKLTITNCVETVGNHRKCR